LDVKRIVIELL